MTRRLTQIINGVEYVYENISEWSEKKKKQIYRRRYLGKMEGGKFIPNSVFKLEEKLKNASPILPEELFGSSLQAKACGATEFMERLSRQLGIADHLEECFPDDAEIIESLGYYLGIEFEQPLNRFHRWALVHEHPAGEDLPDSELIALQKRIRPTQTADFFQRQMKKRGGSHVTVYSHDVLGSLQQTSSLLQKGAEASALPWRRFFTFYNSASGLPCAFIQDFERGDGIRGLEFLRAALKDFGVRTPLFISAQPFADKLSVDWMLEKNWKFILQPANSKAFFEEKFGQISYPTPDNPQGWAFNPFLNLYLCTKKIKWEWEEKAKNQSRTVWIHCFYNPDLRSATLGTPLRGDESFLGDYGEKELRYFHTFAGGLPTDYGVRMLPNSFIFSPSSQEGLTVLISNSEKDPFSACNAFRRQDFQYDLFSNLSERFYLRPFSYSGSEPAQVLHAQFFLQFLGLIFFDASRKEHSKSGLWAEMFHTTLLDELDTIQRYTQRGKGSKISRLTEEQKDIYRKLGLKAPGSRK